MLLLHHNNVQITTAAAVVVVVVHTLHTYQHYIKIKKILKSCLKYNDSKNTFALLVREQIIRSYIENEVASKVA